MSIACDESKAIFLDLYESIWAISDAIGFNIETINNRIPNKHIEPSGLALRLLLDSVQEISNNLALLEKLERIHLGNK